jgi:putative DNA primase/helicase
MDAVSSALGHAPDHITPGRLQRFATSNKRDDDAGWCLLKPDLRAGHFGDWRSGVHHDWFADDGAPTTVEQSLDLRDQIAAARAASLADDERKRSRAAKQIVTMLAQTVAITAGDPVARYLRGRGITCHVPGNLYLHPALPYWHEGACIGSYPAMIAPLVAPDGSTVALHRTYLGADGCKADVPQPKKLTSSAAPLRGAAVPLFAPRDGVVGVAEGIETALAAHCMTGLPTVAAYSASGVAQWDWPPGVERVVIFADYDDAGEKASEALRRRCALHGIRANVIAPSVQGQDWCDVWQSESKREEQS